MLIQRLYSFSVITAAIYKTTGFVYADPIASTFVGVMIMGTAWPIISRSGKILLDVAPDGIDMKGVKEDVERISGAGSIHDLHVWSVGQSLLYAYGLLHYRYSRRLDNKSAIASLHLLQTVDSLKNFDMLCEDIRKVSRACYAITNA